VSQLCQILFTVVIWASCGIVSCHWDFCETDVVCRSKGHVCLSTSERTCIITQHYKKIRKSVLESLIMQGETFLDNAFTVKMLYNKELCHT